MAACPHSADPGARLLSVADMIRQLERVAPFVEGITASGGEPTCQPAFVQALFKAIKSTPTLSRLTTLLDTNGTLNATLWEELCPWTDGVMLDLKSFDHARHLAMTGRALTEVCAGLERVHARGKLYEVRVLVVPGFNDDRVELTAMADYLYALDAGIRVRPIAYHPRNRFVPRQPPRSPVSVIYSGSAVLARSSPESNDVANATSQHLAFPSRIMLILLL